MRKTALFMTAMLILMGVVEAADKGVQKAPATGDTSIGVLISPAGTTERFTPTFLFCPGEQDTQTVSWVSGAITNQVLVFTNTASLKFIALPDMPPLFYGDKILVKRPTRATLTNETVTVYGTLTD